MFPEFTLAELNVVKQSVRVLLGISVGSIVASPQLRHLPSPSMPAIELISKHVFDKKGAEQHNRGPLSLLPTKHVVHLASVLECEHETRKYKSFVCLLINCSFSSSKCVSHVYEFHPVLSAPPNRTNPWVWNKMS